MSLNYLDLIDKKILTELDKDARLSYSKLGKKIKVAKETVKYRIGQLQQNGMIKGFYTVINFSKLGFLIYRLYLRLENTSPEKEAEIIEFLTQSKNVVIFYRVNGSYDLALGVWARNSWEYSDFWTGFRIKFGEFFDYYHLSAITLYSEFSRGYFLPNPSDKTIFTTVSRTQTEALTELDFKLLNFLSNHARASVVEMAKALGISEVTAHNRFKNLVSKKIILGFRPIFDLSKLGREYYKVDLRLKKFDKIQEIKQAVLSHPNTIYAEETLVSSDLEFDVETKDFEAFIEMMDGFKTKFPNDVKSYTYYSRIKNYKTSYLPSAI